METRGTALSKDMRVAKMEAIFACLAFVTASPSDSTSIVIGETSPSLLTFIWLGGVPSFQR